MPRYTISLSVLLITLTAACVHGQEDGEEPLTMTRDEWVQLIDERLAELPSTPSAVSNSTAMDPALVERGRAAFDMACTECHDAERSLERRKSYGAWLATVRRMAAKEDADIASSDFEPIAAYLASLNPAGELGGPMMDSSGGVTPSVSAFGTFSTLWRGTNDEQPLENPDFFVDAWVGADWQPSGPVSGRIVGCTSCHADQNQSLGFSLELVEASATLDLMSLFCGCGDSDHDSGIDATIKAGRFIVPFGAFSALSYPGVYRTVTNPLMYNMGRRVGPTGPLQPVLPLPFSDEGVNGHLGATFFDCWTATLDVYAINGLQDPSPRIFNSSRSYMDNNREPTVGGRATIGNKTIRLGGSLMTGNLADDGLNAVPYKISGVDATFRHEWLRAYFEYAIRENDTFLPGRESYAYGIVAEIEAKLLDNYSFIVRYDTLEHRDVFAGESSLERLTYGLNTSLPGGSWVGINHEHWMFQNSDVDVLGVRWTATF